MAHHIPIRAGSLLLAGVLLLPLLGAATRAAADPPPAAIDKRVGAAFDVFCREWMKRLETRQRRNVKSAASERSGNVFSVRFVGYSHEPVKCEARATGSAASPFVGQIVYHEIHFEKTGHTLKAARRSKPVVLGRTEVMEIFRHDGSNWTW